MSSTPKGFKPRFAELEAGGEVAESDEDETEDSEAEAEEDE